MTYWKELAKAAVIRAVKTMAQTAVGMIAVGAAISEVDWLNVASVAVVAGVLSILTSLAGLPEVAKPVMLQTKVNEDAEGITEEVEEVKEG